MGPIQGYRQLEARPSLGRHGDIRGTHGTHVASTRVAPHPGHPQVSKAAPSPQADCSPQPPSTKPLPTLGPRNHRPPPQSPPTLAGPTRCPPPVPGSLRGPHSRPGLEPFPVCPPTKLLSHATRPRAPSGQGRSDPTARPGSILATPETTKTCSFKAVGGWSLKYTARETRGASTKVSRGQYKGLCLSG